MNVWGSIQLRPFQIFSRLECLTRFQSSGTFRKEVCSDRGLVKAGHSGLCTQRSSAIPSFWAPG